MGCKDPFPYIQSPMKPFGADEEDFLYVLLGWIFSEALRLSQSDPCSSNSQLHCFCKERLWLEDPLPRQPSQQWSSEGDHCPIWLTLLASLEKQAHRDLSLDVRKSDFA